MNEENVNEKVFKKSATATAPIFGFMLIFGVWGIYLISQENGAWAILVIIGICLLAWASAINNCSLTVGENTIKISKPFVKHDIPYDKINTISTGRGDTIYITVGNDYPITFTWLDNLAEAKKLIDEKIHTIEQKKHDRKPDPKLVIEVPSIEQLERLGKLYKEGLLTKEEFDEQKKQLLK